MDAQGTCCFCGRAFGLIPPDRDVKTGRLAHWGCSQQLFERGEWDSAPLPAMEPYEEGDDRRVAYYWNEPLGRH